MKIIFAGTPPFARTALEALDRAGHELVLVLTQPDRPAGRGMRLTQSAVGDYALSRGMAIAKPPSLKDPAAQQVLRNATAEVMVVAAYGLLLPQAVLDIPPRGCLNIHASLLPRWRGAAPIHRAIEAGDAETGVDIMQMEAGLDTGPVLLEKRISIASDDTTGTLTDKLAHLGGEAIVEALARLDSLKPQVQDHTRATYAKKIDKTESRIDWTQPAAVIERRMRAFDPFPGCETMLEGKPVKLWRAHVVTGRGAPGHVIDVQRESIVVACGEGALAVTELQNSGGKKMDALRFLQGTSIRAGSMLGA